MTAGTAIMIIGRGITDKGLDDGRDLTSLYRSVCGPSHDFGPWDGPSFLPLVRRTIFFSKFSKYLVFFF
jgi:hypothetical protein